MNRPDLKFALRALRGEVTTTLFWAIVAGVTLILSISAPFGTAEVLGIATGVAFWGMIVVITYCLGFVATMSLQPTVAPLPFIARALIQGSAVAVVVTPTVLALCALFLGVLKMPAQEIAVLAAIIAGISYVVTTTMLTTLPLRETLAQQRAAAPPLLAELPLEKRGAIISLSAEDHHVRVQTDAGEHWLRMRLSDAMKAAAPTNGLQVHRSHWVATAAIASVARKGKGGVLTMTHGTDIPVSRAQMDALRNAGLLV